jgi:hypothetical protein
MPVWGLACGPGADLSHLSARTPFTGPVTAPQEAWLRARLRGPRKDATECRECGVRGQRDQAWVICDTDCVSDRSCSRFVLVVLSDRVTEKLAPCSFGELAACSRLL